MNDFRAGAIMRLNAEHRIGNVTYRLGWADVVTDGPISNPVVAVSVPFRVVFTLILGELLPSVETASSFDTLMLERGLYPIFESELLDVALGTVRADETSPMFTDPISLRLPDWFRR